MTIDDARNALLVAGWSIGDALVETPDGPLWEVFAQRSKEKVVTKAPSQLDAWQEALRLSRMNGNEQKMLTPGAIAKLADVSAHTVARLIGNGVLVPTRQSESGYPLFNPEDPKLVEWLKAVRGQK